MLGAELRRLREAAGLTREQAGYTIRASASKMSRLELGRVSFKERDVEDLLELYGVADEGDRAPLITLAREANAPGWWHQYGDVLPGWFHAYIGLEEAASRIRTYEVQFVPGLLQTEDYARAIAGLGHTEAPQEEIERRVSLRMMRKQTLTRPNAPRLWAVMDEAALQRPIGGSAVLRSQIEHLIEIASWPSVTLQVLPFSAGGHAAEGGAFTLLRFSEEDLPDVVYIEQLTGALYLEKRDDVDRYIEVMNRLSVEAETPDGSIKILEQLLRDV